MTAKNYLWRVGKGGETLKSKVYIPSLRIGGLSLGAKVVDTGDGLSTG